MSLSQAVPGVDCGEVGKVHGGKSGATDPTSGALDSGTWIPGTIVPLKRQPIVVNPAGTVPPSQRTLSLLDKGL